VGAPPPAAGGAGGRGGAGGARQQNPAAAVEVAGATIAIAPPAAKAPFVVVVPSAPEAAPAPAVVAEPTDVSPPPEFLGGFAFLEQQLGAIMGLPLEPEHASPDSCDTEQRTTTGLAYWRCATNTLSFVASSADGVVHWAWLDHLVTWRGEGVDPPADAVSVASAPPLDEVCLGPGPTPDTPCPLADGMSMPGYIQAAGQTNTYRFEVTSPTMHITADLTDLPADYDLYLVDAGGSLLGASVQEGTEPESVDMQLSAGTYYLFVHSDPGRTFDADNPYTLHLTMAASPPTTAAPLPPETP
jgi:hypothetical protein